MTTAIKLPRALVNQLLHLAQQSPDQEICGLISAKTGALESCYPVINVAKDKKRFFKMDPRGQVDAMRHIRENGEELAAIFHSHPHTPALPSMTDIQRHEYPDLLYLIVSLNIKGVLEMRGFRIRDEKICEIKIGI